MKYRYFMNKKSKHNNIKNSACQNEKTLFKGFVFFQLKFHTHTKLTPTHITYRQNTKKSVDVQ